MLTALRIANVVIWLSLLACVLPGALAAVRGTVVRRADMWQLSVALVSAFIVLGNVRWLVAPGSDTLFAAIYVLGAVVGLFKIYLAQTYGRGPRL